MSAILNCVSVDRMECWVKVFKPSLLVLIFILVCLVSFLLIIFDLGMKVIMPLVICNLSINVSK